MKMLEDLEEVVRVVNLVREDLTRANHVSLTDTETALAIFVQTHAAEIERNARDAARYRWLRDVAWSLPAISQQELPAVAVFSGSGRRCKDISGEEMDRAIDDAMKLEPTHG